MNEPAILESFEVFMENTQGKSADDVYYQACHFVERLKKERDALRCCGNCNDYHSGASLSGDNCLRNKGAIPYGDSCCPDWNIAKRLLNE